MKYQAPYGSSDPDEEYVDRNSSTATSGSKLPAGFPNWTQREIVNVIEKAGFTPDDVLQLAAAIQSGRLHYAVAGGTANALTATLLSAPPALVDGLTVVLTIGVANTGAATLNVNGLGALPIVNLFGAPLVGGELVGPVRFTYGAAKWWASVVQPSLSADRVYYVRPDGNDSNNGLANNAGGAFLTIQKAIDTVATIDRRGYNLDIQIANGTYAGFSTRTLTGSGSTRVTGNVASPGSVIVQGATNAGIIVSHDGWFFEGMRPTAAATAGAHCFQVDAAATQIGAMEWPLNTGSGSNGGSHMALGGGASLTISGVQRVIGGASQAHIFSTTGSSFRASPSNPPSLVIVGTVGFGDFIFSNVGAIVSLTYSAITNAAGVNNGRKFNVASNGVVNTNGAGVNYFPGPTAGVTSTGGQYA